MYRAAYACHLDHEADIAIKFIGMSRLGRFPTYRGRPWCGVGEPAVMHLQNTAAEVKGLAAGSLVALTTLQSRRGERREAFS